MKPICLLPVGPHYLNGDVDPDSCEYVLAHYGTNPAMVHVVTEAMLKARRQAHRKARVAAR